MATTFYTILKTNKQQQQTQHKLWAFPLCSSSWIHLLQFDIVRISFFTFTCNYYYYFFFTSIGSTGKNDVLVVLNNRFVISAILQKLFNFLPKQPGCRVYRSYRAIWTHRGAFARWGADFQRSKPTNAYLFTNQGHCPFGYLFCSNTRWKWYLSYGWTCMCWWGLQRIPTVTEVTAFPLCSWKEKEL